MTEEEKIKYASEGAETWSDLETAHIKDPKLAAKLKRLSRNYRQASQGDKPLDVFVPTLADISSKDDYSLMDIAVFGLGKKPRFKPIEHDLNDAHITVSGSTKYGMATIFDYDIFLYIVSYLTREMERCKDEVKRGHDASLPARKISPPVTELLKFCQRDDGGRNYKQLEKALERLSTTKILIKEKREGKSHRRIGMFSLIGDYEIVKATRTGNISKLVIAIPDWVYDGVVRPTKPTVLTFDNDYFLLSQGYHRFLHRLARKAAGKTTATYSLETLYERSGSTRPFRSFKADVKKAIEALKEAPLPDYHVQLVKKGDIENVILTYTGENSA